MEYTVAFKQTDDGFSVWVPGLPGCWSQGHTHDEALENIREAIKLYLEVALELAVKNSENLFKCILHAKFDYL